MLCPNLQGMTFCVSTRVYGAMEIVDKTKAGSTLEWGLELHGATAGLGSQRYFCDLACVIRRARNRLLCLGTAPCSFSYGFPFRKLETSFRRGRVLAKIRDQPYRSGRLMLGLWQWRASYCEEDIAGRILIMKG